jgi:L-fuculose-phosphate aldolase
MLHRFRTGGILLFHERVVFSDDRLHEHNTPGSLMPEKIEIEELPLTDRFLRRKRLVQERGELALIEDGPAIRHLGYFSLKKGEGYFRGGHAHEKKTERFYIISGSLRLQYVDLESGEKGEVPLHSGMRVAVHPRCAHRFRAREDAQVIEYYDSVYDPHDDQPYEFKLE